ncbi:hypothetical protein V7056_08175 [Bacillus sp. JJ664]
MDTTRVFFRWINKNRDKGDLYFILLVVSVILTSAIMTKLFEPNLAIAMLLCFIFLVIFRIIEDCIDFLFKARNKKEQLYISIIPHSLIISITFLLNYF